MDAPSVDILANVDHAGFIDHFATTISELG